MSDDSDTPDADATIDHRPGAAAGPGPLGALGRFQLQAELGQGGFGVVYRAYDPLLERPVALKVPKLRADQADLVERFLREAKAVARLRHRGVVAVYDCGTDRGQVYIALEYVEGQTLADRLRDGRPAFRQAAQWVRDLALALDYAHREQVIHRDVKPANVMIDRAGTARLMDFGLAKDYLPAAGGAAPTDPTLTRHGTVLGTPAYMAPEQARGETALVGPLSDQYSLGVVLYELLQIVGERDCQRDEWQQEERDQEHGEAAEAVSAAEGDQPAA